MHLSVRLLVLTTTLLAAVTATAEDPPRAQDDPAPVHEERISIEDRILGAGTYLEKKVDQLADKIDITLAGKKYTKKPNDSRLDVQQLFTFSEGGRQRSAADFSLNMRLPNVEKRWQLRFVSYDEERESRDVQNQRVRTRPREREYSAGLLFFQRLGKVKTSFIPRLQLKDPLDVSYVARFESEGNWAPVKFIPRLDLFADPKKGTGEFMSWEFHIQAIEKLLEISWVNTEEYQAKDNYFTTQHAISGDYALNDFQAIGAGVNWSSHNKPSFHLDTFTVSTVFAQLIYRNRLSTAVTPFLLFPKTKGFKGDVGVTLSLDLSL